MLTKYSTLLSQKKKLNIVLPPFTFVRPGTKSRSISTQSIGFPEFPFLPLTRTCPVSLLAPLARSGRLQHALRRLSLATPGHCRRPLPLSPLLTSSSSSPQEPLLSLPACASELEVKVTFFVDGVGPACGGTGYACGGAGCALLQ
jgi:hypothetical protein